MSFGKTIYVFRESKDLFPSQSLLLAFSPSLQNCQEMNFNLEELLHLSLWICLTLDKFEDVCCFLKGPWEFLWGSESSHLTFFLLVQGSEFLNPCSRTGWALGLLLSPPGHICTARNSHETYFWGATEEGPLPALSCGNPVLWLISEMIHWFAFKVASHFKGK